MNKELKITTNILPNYQSRYNHIKQQLKICNVKEPKKSNKSNKSFKEKNKNKLEN